MISLDLMSRTCFWILLQAAGGQGSELEEALEARDLPALAAALRRADEGPGGIQGLGRGASGLLRLPPGELETLLSHLSSSRGPADSGPIEHALRALLESHRGNPVPAAERFAALLPDPVLRPLIVPHVGRGALQLCRSGRVSGSRLLQEILRYYSGAAWAWGNHGLGLRFLGRYEDAGQAYRRALALGGRQAWILNDHALVEQARRSWDRALALFLEGSRAQGDARDRDTCRTNAARLLMQRRGPGDLGMARILLETVVQGGSMARRPRYWLAQLRHPR